MNPRYLSSIDQLDNLVGLNSREREEMERVCERFPFRANEYYLSLINWQNKKDPLRRIVIPDPQELKGGGLYDPSSEKNYTKLQGVQHKYSQTGLLLLSDVCGGICRFCFRKRLFLKEEPETIKDVSAGIDYIRHHPEITNVLLTGGDPLVLETSFLESILHELRKIEHVGIIRIGSKIPAYNPYRILEDDRLCSAFQRYSTPEKRIYLMAHFTHPGELTNIALQAIERLQKCGVIVVHQTPVLNGINSESAVFTQLFRRLSFMGVSPYYVFQCRPSIGNQIFQVPVERAYHVIQKAWQACSGLAKQARFVMSHTTGKIEVVGHTARHIFMRYHQAANPDDLGKFLILRSNKNAFWFDDYSHHDIDDI
jgi:KamA family protein